jgi:hypothetical protein
MSTKNHVRVFIPNEPLLVPKQEWPGFLRPAKASSQSPWRTTLQIGVAGDLSTVRIIIEGRDEATVAGYAQMLNDSP